MQSLRSVDGGASRMRAPPGEARHEMARIREAPPDTHTHVAADTCRCTTALVARREGREGHAMTRHKDFEAERRHEEFAKKSPGKAPGYDKKPPPAEAPRPHEAAPPEVRKPSRPR